MTCETCGAELEIRDVSGGVFTYRCLNDHWWQLINGVGWVAMPPPAEELDPSAAGVAF